MWGEIIWSEETLKYFQQEHLFNLYAAPFTYKVTLAIYKL